MIPETFEAWMNCIVNECKINLTPDFAEKRLAVLTDSNQDETQKFVACYGEHHLQQVISWYEKIKQNG